MWYILLKNILLNFYFWTALNLQKYCKDMTDVPYNLHTVSPIVNIAL